MLTVLGIVACAALWSCARDGVASVWHRRRAHVPRILELEDDTSMMPPRTYYLENRTPYAGELDTRDGVEVKFVGGPLDGTTRHVPPDAREWRVTGESYRVYTRVNAYTFQFVSVQTHHMCEHNRGYTVEALLEEHNEWTKRQSRA